MAAPALLISVQSIPPNFLATSANISSAAPIMTSDVAEVSIFLGLIFCMRYWKPANSAKIIPTADTPLASPSQLIWAMSLHTDAMIFNAAAMMTILVAPFTTVLPSRDIIFIAATTTAVRPATPVRPRPISS